MATITLRPNSDISFNHTRYTNGTSGRTGAGYTFIDDTTSDEAATAIGQAHHSTTTTSKTSTFGLGGTTHNHAIFVNSITLHYDYWCNNPASKGAMNSIAISTAISVAGTKSNPISNSIANVGQGDDSGNWKTLSSEFNPVNFSALTTAYESLSALNLQFDITTEWKCSSNQVTTDQYIYISQVYAVVDYTDAYLCTAVGNETTNVTEIGYVKNGSEVHFEASPVLNHRFLGWYSNSAMTTSVSTAQIYTRTVNSANITLYANSKRIEAINIYYKQNGQWSKVKNIYLKENGAYKALSAEEFGNQLYFSDKSYLKI